MCDSLKQDNTIIGQSVTQAFDTWRSVLDMRQAEVTKVVKEWEDSRGTYEAILGEEGYALLKRSKEQLTSMLTTRDHNELHRQHPIELARVTKEIRKDPLYKHYDALEKQYASTLKRLQSSRKELNHSMWTRDDGGDETLDKARGQADALIMSQTAMIIEKQKEKQELIRKELEKRLGDLRLKLANESIAESAKRDSSFREYRAKLQHNVTRLQHAINGLQAEVQEAAALHAKERSVWEDKLNAWGEQMAKECKDIGHIRMVIQQRDKAFVANVVNEFRRQFYMPAPPPVGAPSACDENGIINPMPYQRLVATLFDRSTGLHTNGLLMYHDMGTGKTLSIVLVVDAMYRYYLQEDKLKELTVERIPCVLIYVQSKTAITTYASQVASVRSKGGAVVSTEWVEQPLNKGREHGRMYILHDKDGRPVLRVVTWRMTKLLEGDALTALNTGYKGYEPPLDYCGSKVDFNTTHGKRFLPHRGMVIVDEAHNLFNAADVSNYGRNETHGTKHIYDQLKSRRDLPLLLSTGTPILDMNSLADLLKLIDLVRRPCDKSEYIVPDGRYDNTSLIRRFFVIDDKVKDDDADDDNDDDGKVGPLYVSDWQKGMRDIFKQMVTGYVSFMTLENDPRRYPRQVARFPGHPTLTDKDYVVTASFTTESQQDFSRVHFTLNTEAARGFPTVTVRVPTHPDTWRCMTKPKNSGSSNRRTSECDVIPHKWIALVNILKQYKTYKHFIFHPTPGRGTSEHDSGFRSNPRASRRDVPLGLIPFMRLTDVLGCQEVDYKADRDIFDPVVFGADVAGEERRKLDSSQDPESVVLKRKVDEWYDRYGNIRALRAAYLFEPGGQSEYRVSRDNRVILGIFNDARNRDGDHVRYIFGTMPHKEGVSLFTTGFCHIMQPLSSTSAFAQVSARIKRNCGFSQIDDTNKWLTTVITYVATPPEPHVLLTKSTKNARRSMTNDGDAQFEMLYARPRPALLATEMALQTIEQTAIDCAMFGDYLRSSGKPWRGRCGASHEDQYGSETMRLAYVNGMCYDPTGRHAPAVIGHLEKDGRIIRNIEDCHAQGMVPGTATRHGDDDELLYQVLKYFGYKATPLIRRELIRDFARHVQRKRSAPAAKASEGIWSRLKKLFTVNLTVNKEHSDHNGEAVPRLTLNHDVPVPHLIQWIRYNPREIGDSVVYLLEQKRKTLKAEELERLEKSVEARRNIFLLTQQRQDEADRMLKELHLRIQDATEKLREPLWRVRELQKLVREKWTYA